MERMKRERQVRKDIGGERVDKEGKRQGSKGE
jgi:hypothetical protein